VAVFAVRAIDVPRAVDRVFCTAMFFQGWGNALHLFSAFWWYLQQRSHHLPMSLAPILYIGFARLGDVVPAPAGCAGSDSELCGMTLITCCLGVTAASFYEIYEWVVDDRFGRHVFIGEADTITDLADGFRGGGPWSGCSSSACGRAVPRRLGAHALHEPPSCLSLRARARQRRTVSYCSTTSTTP
jgi:hypothetical protein